MRFLAAGKGLSAAFTAHPAGVLAEEWQAISAPLSIGFAGMPFSVSLFSPIIKLPSLEVVADA